MKKKKPLKFTKLRSSTGARPDVGKALPKIECTFHTPDMEPLPVPAPKSRRFQILVQCTDSDGNVVRQAIFTDLSKANGYIQIREACDNLKALPGLIEIDPEVVGQWKVEAQFAQPEQK